MNPSSYRPKWHQAMLRSLSDIARRNGHSIWLFAGSDKGGERIANILTIIETVKLHGHNPELYLTDVLTRIQDHPKDRFEDLLPWNWMPAKARCEAA